MIFSLNSSHNFLGITSILDTRVSAFWSTSGYNGDFSRDSIVRRLYAKVRLIHFQNASGISLIHFETGRKYQFEPMSKNLICDWIKVIFSTIFKVDQSDSLRILKVDQTDFHLQVTYCCQVGNLLSEPFRSGSKCSRPR